MNIQTVAENLRVTVARKEQHLLHLQQALVGLEMMDTTRTVIDTTAKFLEVNLDELRRILKDVEQCEPSLPGEVFNHYEKWDGDK